MLKKWLFSLKFKQKSINYFLLERKTTILKKQIRKIKGETNEKYLYLLQRKID